MNFIEAVILGVVQGLTEFLPVSSSGHLVLGQHFLGITEPQVLFDVTVHGGTLMAVICVLYREILGAAAGFFRLVAAVFQGRGREVLGSDEGARMALMIIVGSFPTGVMGLFMHDAADRLFGSPSLAASMLMVTGVLLLATRRVSRPGAPILKMGPGQSFFIGVVQGFAILPGISRSGSTIAAGLFAGVERDTAAKFSFLLSIPAILGALVLEIHGAGGSGGSPMGVFLAGGIAAAVTGFAALKLLLWIVHKGRLWWFAPYCLALGAGSLIFLG